MNSASTPVHFLRFLAGCFLAMGLSIACAQRYSFTEPATGLDNLDIDCAAQDSVGFLWIGTENGLYQFDGARFNRIGAEQGLYARTIQDILAGPSGTLLVGTTEGIFFRDTDGRFREIQHPDPTSRFLLRIGSVFTPYGPNRFVVADWNGVYELSRSGPTGWTVKNMHIGSSPIWSVLTDPAGTLWFGCGDELCRFQSGKVEHLGAVLHLPRDHWAHMLVDRQQHLWIRGSAHLGEIDPVHMRYTERSLPGHANATHYDAFTMDASGRILASFGSSFGIWTGNRWRLVTPRNGLSNFDISVLIPGREGSLWIANVGHGLLRWIGQDRWEAFTAADGLSSDIVWGSLRDRAGRLWVASEAGLDWMPPGSSTLHHWRSLSGSTAHSISLTQDSAGNVWLGTASGSLFRIDARTLIGRFWNIPNVYRLLMAPGNRLWIATVAGLYVMDTASRNPVPQLVTASAFEHPRTRVRDLCFGPRGEMWASSDEALYRYDAHGWARIDTGLSGIVPHQIATDRKGNLWATGSFAGLVRLRFSANTVIEAERILRPRLLSEQPVSLSVDSRDWVWVGQDAGVSVFDGHRWRSFTQNDGLIWNDTDTYGLYEDRDGSMWIGTSGGISHLLHPEDAPSFTPSRPAIEQIAYGSHPLAAGARIRWDLSPLTLSVASLNFGNAHRTRLRYRLLGLEQDWVETAQDTIRYPRLSPGRYTFQAIATDISGTHFSPVTEISFRILPRWWQTWAFRLALALLALSICALLLRWQVRRLVRQKNALEKAIQERTRELEHEKAELRHTHRQMRHFAEIDELTGLLNHRVTLNRLRGEIERARREHAPLSIILFDLDRFKSINDTYGHQTGDAILKEVGFTLQRSIRSYDWVGRYGGEEFLVILPGSGLNAARARAEQMRLAIKSAAVLAKEQPIYVTASLGVVSGFLSTAESAIREADAALNRAKHNGRDCVVAVEIEPPEAADAPAS